MAMTSSSLKDFLQPLAIDLPKIHSLASRFCKTFKILAARSQNQFLPTPISELLLSPSGDEQGRYLAIDIGGTNLRVGFIELLGLAGSTLIGNSLDKGTADQDKSRVRRQLEKVWPIEEHLKIEKAEDLFGWIGKCVAEVVQDACDAWPGEMAEEIPMGVTFSFPMIQHTLSDAKLMSMGKGFAITSNLNLGEQLLAGYDRARNSSLPKIRIAAIANDAVATLISFFYQLRKQQRRKAAMALIGGTGSNATIPLPLSCLHPSKRSYQAQALDDGGTGTDFKIVVNTEWSINGSAAPLRELNIITTWDETLDAEGEVPGFQPFEYMTAGRYLGELGRLIIVDYLTNQVKISERRLPPKLRRRHGLSTAFLGNLSPHLSHVEPSIVEQLEVELPQENMEDAWRWTPATAEVVYQIAKAIQVRAAAMTAAAIIGLLAFAGEIHLSSTRAGLPNGEALPAAKSNAIIDELMVGYTGGCIVHFQDYLVDCQDFLDKIMEREFGDLSFPRVVLQSCHDGGIIGAGILAGTVQSIAQRG